MTVDDYTGREKASWGLVGDCGGRALLEWRGNYRYIIDTEQSVAWMKVGVAFLVNTFGPPPSNAVLGILWYHTPHGSGRAPTIGIGSDEWTAELKEYFDQVESGLVAFDEAMNWAKAPRISTEIRESLSLSVNFYQELE